MNNPKRQCKAKSKSTGTQCKRAPIVGGEVCTLHGGKAPQVVKKAAERVQEAEIRAMLANLGEPKPVDPGQALLSLIAAKNGEVQWLRSIVKDLDRDEMVWGTAQHSEGVDGQGPVDKTTEKAAPSVWWDMLRKAEDQLASFASQALRAGIEERRVRLAESQGSMVAAAVRRILGRLNLDVSQQELVGVVVPEELRRMAGAL